VAWLTSLWAKVPESVFRALGLAFFAGWIAFRIHELAHDPDTRARSDFLALWVLETLIYALMLWGYVRRTPALERASTLPEVLLPVVGGPFPFLLLLERVPATLVVRPEVPEVLIFLGDVIAATSYAFLGGSFSILVDARPLRERGPYRLVRHPVYVGQLLATLGVILVRFSPRNVALWVVFVAVQVGRAVLEERKLARATPGYAEYRARTWMFVPFIV
jgi:protein-S-isoprenylcysteine O-methyltransferase Ste14